MNAYYIDRIYTSFIHAQTHIALYIIPPKRERERERERERAKTRKHTRTPETDRPNNAIIIKVIRHAGRP